MNQNLTPRPLNQENQHNKDSSPYLLEYKQKLSASKGFEEKPVLTSKEIIANNLNSSLRSSSVLQSSINK